MRTWERLGSFVSHNMAFIVPVGVMLGMFFPQAFSWIRPALAVFFAFVTFQGSLSNTFGNLARAVRHPLPMIAAILISQLALPLIGWGAGLALHLERDLVSGIVLEWSVPIAVTSTMWVGVYEGDMALALGTLLISTLVSPFTIPLTLKVLMGTSVAVDARGMFLDMVFMVALPALVGTALNDVGRGWAKRVLSPVLAPLARLLVVVVITVNATSLNGLTHGLSPEYVGIIVLTWLMITCGYLLGFGVARLLGLGRGAAVTLTFCSALKNISAGAVIAQEHLGARAMIPVMCGTIFNQVLAAIYGRLFSRSFE